MTYTEWFKARTTHEGPKAREVYVEITGDEDGAAGYSGVVEFPAGFLLITNDGQYDAICGRDQLVTPDIKEAAQFLWNEHSKYEVA